LNLLGSLAAGPLDGVGQTLGHVYNVLAFLAYPFSIVLGALYHFFAGFGPLQVIGPYGLAIVCLTLIIKTLLFPLFQMQLKLTKKAQEEQRKVAPQLAALRKKHKGDAARLNTEMMALYKEHGINPLSSMTGCLPALVQLPVLIGLYRSIYQPPVPFLPSGSLHQHFLGLDMQIAASLNNPVTWILPALAGLTTFIQSKMVAPPQPASGDDSAAQMAQMTQSMSLLMPVMIIFFAFQPYALQGLVLYWAVSSVFGITQQYFASGWGQVPFLGRKDSISSATGQQALAAGGGPARATGLTSTVVDKGGKDRRPTQRRGSRR